MSTLGSIGWGAMAFGISFTLNPVLGGLVTDATPKAAPISASVSQKIAYDNALAKNKCSTKPSKAGEIPTKALVFVKGTTPGYRMVSFDEGWKAYETKSKTMLLVTPCYPTANAIMVGQK